MWLCRGFQWRGTIKKAEHQRIDFLNHSVGENSQSPLDCKKIKPVNPKGNQSWIFIRRTDAEAEALVLWPPDLKSWLIRKDPDAGKDWRQEKGTTEDEMIGWHHKLDGHESEQALGVGDGQGSLACCNPRGCKELDTTGRLNWTDAVLTLGVGSYLFLLETVGKSLVKPYLNRI